MKEKWIFDLFLLNEREEMKWIVNAAAFIKKVKFTFFNYGVMGYGFDAQLFTQLHFNLFHSFSLSLFID